MLGFTFENRQIRGEMVKSVKISDETFQMHISKFILFIGWCFLISACGGGGGDSGSQGGDELAQDDAKESDSVKEEFVVQAHSSENGTISPLSVTVPEGESASFELRPEEFHEIGSVSGCNGELDGSTYTTGQVESECEITSEFNHIAVADTWIIADPVDAYIAECETAVLFLTIPTDLNRDSHQDLLIHYWCGLDNFGTAIKTPTRDALAALINDGSGDFTLNNTEVFGASFAQLGGAARKYSSGDLNGDGIEDFSFAMNWEDGRSSSDVTDIAAQPAAILSQADGTYSVEQFGTPDWGHATEIITNSDGTSDALFAGFVDGIDLQSWAWDQSDWVDSSVDYPATSYATALGSSKDTSGNTDHIFGSGGTLSPNMDMLTKADGTWELSSRYVIERLFETQWYSWNGALGPVNVVEVNGKRYFGGAYFQTCTASNVFGNNDRYLIGKVSSAAIDEEIVAGQIYDERNARPVNVLQFFRIDENQLVPVESPIVNEEININANFFDCSDINNDGLADVVVYAYTQPWAGSRENAGGKPIVYINDGAGSLVKKSLEAIPEHSTAGKNGVGPSLQSLVRDMNGDGVKDIILMGEQTGGVGSSVGNFEIHIMREAFWND